MARTVTIADGSHVRKQRGKLRKKPHHRHDVPNLAKHRLKNEK